MPRARRIVLDRVHSRMVDEIAVREYGMSGLVLMENAGRGCAEELIRLGANGDVLVCCGGGNNGGDGFVIARHLANVEIDVRVWVAARPTELAADARANFEILRKTNVPLEILADANEGDLRRKFGDESERGLAWIVDALLGTGAQGSVRPPLDAWIRMINSSAAKVLAVDIPSGLDCDAGEPNGECVQADRTCTFVALKPCFLREPGKGLAGKVAVIDVGVPKEIVAAVERLQRGPGAVDFGQG